MDELFEALKAHPSDALTIILERDVIEEGKTLSVEAMTLARDQMLVFVGARMSAFWERTSVPPTVVTINLEVSIR